MKAARKAQNVSQEEAAERIGVSRVTIADWESERAAPTKKQWAAIERALGVRLILTAEQDVSPYVMDDKYAFIDRLAVKVSAGNGRENDFEEIEGHHAYRRDWLLKKGLPISALKVVDAEGESMWPSINHSDVVLVNTADRKLKSGGVYAFRTEEGCRFKRLFKQLDGRIRVVSDNPDKISYPDEWLTPGMEAEIIGAVVHRSGGV